MADNWEYLVAGAAIVAGVALMFTGVGGPAGVALMAASGGLISGGISIGVQKYQTGSVDVGVVLRDTAIGTFAGGLGGGTGWLMGLRYGAEAAAPAIASGTVEGGVTGVLNYATSPGPHGGRVRLLRARGGRYRRLDRWRHALCDHRRSGGRRRAHPHWRDSVEHYHTRAPRSQRHCYFHQTRST